MLILTIRTDKPEAEVGLFEDSAELGYITWSAHRQLSDTIHIKIKELLQSTEKDWTDIEGVACYKGPGSFTGLRIGTSVANALAGALAIPIVAFTSEQWKQQSIEALRAGTNHQNIVPKYGAEPHTTKPAK